MQRKRRSRFSPGLSTVVPMEGSSAAFPMPKVVMTKEVLEKIFRYAAVADNEVGGVGFIEERGSELYISEAFLLPQVASEVEMTLDPMALNEFVGDCETPEMIKMQWHSHGFGSVFFSSQDVSTISGYDMPYAVSIVVNKNFDIRCRIDIFAPLYVCFEAVVFVEISKENDPYWDKAKEEVGSVVKDTSILLKRKKHKVRVPERMLIPVGEAAGTSRIVYGGGLL